MVPVDLVGQPADYTAIEPLATAEGLLVLANAAQGFGGTLHGQSVGTFGTATATSFFPAKPLGCFGDGGAVFTDDDTLAETMRSLRVHGKGRDKYDNVRIGLNARLDTLQAAVLLEKLKAFPTGLTARQQAADGYAERLADVVRVPVVADGATSAWAQYTLVLNNRAAVAETCKAAGVPTAVYYPAPLHKQTAYAHYPTAPDGCPVSEALSASVLSLPMHPDQDEATLDRVAGALCNAVAMAA